MSKAVYFSPDNQADARKLKKSLLEVMGMQIEEHLQYFFFVKTNSIYTKLCPFQSNQRRNNTVKLKPYLKI
jgi:hypothetical protein